MLICKILLFELFFLNTTNLICRSTDISKCFRGSLRFRDNESQLYFFRSIRLKRMVPRHTGYPEATNATENNKRYLNQYPIPAC